MEKDKRDTLYLAGHVHSLNLYTVQCINVIANRAVAIRIDLVFILHNIHSLLPVVQLAGGGEKMGLRLLRPREQYQYQLTI